MEDSRELDDALEAAWFADREDQRRAIKGEQRPRGMWVSPSDAKKILFMLGKGASRIRPGEYTAEQTMEMVQRLERVVEMERDDD